MSNPWFTADGNPIAATRGVSSLIRTEFTNIQAGFDSAYAASQLRGLKAGETWTGAQNFTGATITVPTQLNTDNTTKAASTAWVVTYVTGVAFAGSLPNQTGNSGKFVTTDGSAASWSSTLKDGTIRFGNSSDLTKLVAFDASAITTATTRTYAWPNKNGTVAMTSDLVATFTSADQTITSAGALTLAHSLGAIPKLIACYLKCVTTELNYSAGDIVAIHPTTVDSTNSQGLSIALDATNVVVRYGSNASTFSLLNKTTGAVGSLTNSKWSLIVKALA